MSTRLVLASGSPRRRELLERAGLVPLVDPAGTDESVAAGELPVAYAQRVAAEKLAAVAVRYPGHDVLAADTVVDLDGMVLGQPLGDDDARRMLRLLSGRTHSVHTAVAAVVGDERRAVTVTSLVTFHRLEEVRVDWYLGTGEPRGKAGGYAVQGLGIALVAGVAGSLSNVVGLPVPETLRLIRR
ncbi:MAG: Maf family protein [Acidimicrobiales bacterium]